mmetsp:Transcript_21199/g.18688  ORF Transcript_21199/g.18688 Transcript_21199/m.18688 type:complete len:144 (+) Transcript_21199:2-433(+)
MIDNQLRKCDNNTDNWRRWTYLEIIQWIVGLEDGRFSNYKQILFKKMKLRNMCGEYLMKMEKIDLETFFGINDFGDICDLWQYIKSLINDENGYFNGNNPNKPKVKVNPLELQDSAASASMFAEHEVDSILDDIIKSENERDH